MSAPTNRRAVLGAVLAAGAATAAATLTTVVAVEPVDPAEPVDPVFEAIERHRVAMEVLRSVESGDPAMDEAIEDESAAMEEMVAASTSIPGVLALLKYIVGHGEAFGSGSVDDFVELLATAPIFISEERTARRSVLDDANPDGIEPDAESIAAFDALYVDWREAQTAVEDPAHDDSDETTDRLCNALYAAEAALAAAPTPTKRQLKHKFHYLEFLIEAGNDGDVEAAVAAIKEDLRRWGFELPAGAVCWRGRRSAEEGA